MWRNRHEYDGSERQFRLGARAGRGPVSAQSICACATSGGSDFPTVILTMIV